MKIGITTALMLALLAGYATPVLALQQLCTVSPENPTLILGMLAAGAAGVPYLGHRARAWFGRKSRRGDRSE
jgi:hypothetical protein